MNSPVPIAPPRPIMTIWALERPRLRPLSRSLIEVGFGNVEPGAGDGFLQNLRQIVTPTVRGRTLSREFGCWSELMDETSARLLVRLRAKAVTLQGPLMIPARKPTSV